MLHGSTVDPVSTWCVKEQPRAGAAFFAGQQGGGAAFFAGQQGGAPSGERWGGSGVLRPSITMTTAAAAKYPVRILVIGAVPSCATRATEPRTAGVPQRLGKQ